MTHGWTTTIFLSYRREDVPYAAGRLRDRLNTQFKVFFDTDNINRGDDFAATIRDAVGKCDILVAVIGKKWSSVKDHDGNRRLDDPDDWIVQEIRTALDRGILVIPVLVDGAARPTQSVLPRALEQVAGLHDASLHHRTFNDDSDRLIKEIALRTWARTPGSPTPRLAVDETQALKVLQVGQRVNAVAFTPDGNLLVTGGPKWVRLWELEGQGTVPWRKMRHGGGLHNVTSVAFSPDGSLLATASSDATARVWKVDSGKLQFEVNHSKSVNSVTFSPDGKRLLTGSSDCTARVWDADSRMEQLKVTHDKAVRSVTFSPDGTRLATGSDDETARVWDADSGSEQLRVPHQSAVLSVSFRPPGDSRLATGSGNIAQVWDAVSRTEKRLQAGYQVSSVVFSPDGSRLATGSRDRTARIWDVITGTELLRVIHDAAVNSIAFCPDGSRLATVSDDGTARIWDVSE